MAVTEIPKDSTAKEFKYVVTNRANDKDDYTPTEMSSEEFIRVFMQRGVKKGVKDGTGIIGAIFRPHSRLEQKNVEMVTALILDVDGKFKRNGEVVVEPVEPDWFIGQLPFRGIAHTSYNHSPSHPKYRVILPLDRPITPEEFRRLWYWAFDKVQKKCDPACKNPDRMFYLARAPAATLESGWPWVRELHGPLLSIDAVPSTFTVPEDGCSPAQPPRRKSGMHFAAPETRYGHTDGHKLLESFKALPLVKWAKENPSLVSREVWRGLATNLGAITLEAEDDEQLFEECLAEFHAISEADGDRYRASDTTKMFNDALRSAKQYGPMTFSRLAENGAPDDACSVEHKTPIAVARNTLRQEERPAQGFSAPAGAAQPAGDTAPASPPPTAAASDPASAEEGVSEEEKDIFDLHPEDLLHDTEIDKYLMRDATGSWDAVKPMAACALDRQLKSLGLPAKNLDSWKSQIRSFNARKAIFNKPHKYYVTLNGVAHFNTYRPTELVPTAGNWDDIRALLLNLTGNDPDGLEFLLDWIAAPLQSLHLHGKPMKMGSTVVFQGEQGSGKGTLDTIIKQLYGTQNVALLDQDALDGRFNGELIDTLFVIANEVISSSNRSMEVANKLKMWITDPMLPIEEKFEGKVQRTNNVNIIFTSNDDKPVIIERDDRRHSVFQSKKFDRAIAARIHDDLRGDKKHVAALFDHLLKRQVKVGFGDFFESDARRQLIAASLPSEARFVESVKEEGWYAVAEPWRSAGNPNNPRISALDDGVVVSSTLQEVYQDFCRRNGIKARSSQVLKKALTPEGSKIVQGFKRIGGINTRVWYGLPMHPSGVVIDFPGNSPSEPMDHESEAGDFSA